MKLRSSKHGSAADFRVRTRAEGVGASISKASMPVPPKASSAIARRPARAVLEVVELEVVLVGFFSRIGSRD